MVDLHKELLTKNAYSICRHGSFKDYVDLYTGLKQGYVNLKEIIILARKKYGDAFNGRLFLEQLLYTADLNNDAIDWLWKPVSKTEMKEFFENLIKKERENLIN